MTSDFKLIKFIIQSLAAVALAGGGLSLQPLPLLRDLFFYVALRVEFFLGNNVFGQLDEGIVDVFLGLGAGLEVKHALCLGVGLIISIYYITGHQPRGRSSSPEELLLITTTRRKESWLGSN